MSLEWRIRECIHLQKLLMDAQEQQKKLKAEIQRLINLVNEQEKTIETEQVNSKKLKDQLELALRLLDSMSGR
jgi:phage shock protein A